MILERAGPKPSRKRTLSTRWGHGGYRALGSLLHLDLVAVFTGSCCQSKYATCLGWRAAGVLPTSTSENRNQASLKPSERVMVNRRVTCRGEVKSVYFTPGSEMLCTVPGGDTKKVSEVRDCLGTVWAPCNGAKHHGGIAQVAAAKSPSGFNNDGQSRSEEALAFLSIRPHVYVVQC